MWGSAVGGLLSWEPVDFGLRSAAVREAEAGVARARADEGLTRLAVQNAVGGAFLAVVSAQQALAAADADVQRREVLARAAHTLADNQLRPGAEASRADAELAAARTRAIQARAAVTLGQTTLARLLGIPDGAGRREHDEAAGQRRARHASTVPAPQHPLVQSEQAAVDLARARETVLTKTDRPRLYLQSSVFARGSGANPDGVFDGGADGLGLDRANWAAGVQVVFPNLFDFSEPAVASSRGGRAHARRERALRRSHLDRDESAASGRRHGRCGPRRCAEHARSSSRRATKRGPGARALRRGPRGHRRSRRGAESARRRRVSGCGQRAWTCGARCWRKPSRRATSPRSSSCFAPRERSSHVVDPRGASTTDHGRGRRSSPSRSRPAFAVTRMRADIFPDLDLPVIYVAQPYGGMSPAQMEGFITYYYEYHFLYINGIESVESKSIQNTSLLKLTFHPGTDMAEALAQTIGYVNRARAFMPPGTVGPFVMRFDAGTVPVGYLVFRSDTRSLGEIQDLALNRVRPQFATLPGLTSPPPFGGSQRTIVIRVDPDRLRSYGMAPDEVIRAVTTGNVIMPSGQRQHRRRDAHLADELRRRTDQRSARAADSQRRRHAGVHSRRRLGQRQHRHSDGVCAGERPAGGLHPGHQAPECVDAERRQRGQGQSRTVPGAGARRHHGVLRAGPVEERVGRARSRCCGRRCSARS